MKNAHYVYSHIYAHRNTLSFAPWLTDLFIFQKKLLITNLLMFLQEHGKNTEFSIHIF